MNALVLLAAACALGGAIAAVSTRDGRVVAIGLVGALAVAPLVPPHPGSVLAVGAEGLGGALAAYLVWLAARRGAASGGSTAGIAAQALAALAAFAAGTALPIVSPTPGGHVAQGAGFALIVLAVVPLLGRDAFRTAVAVLLVASGVALLRTAWLGAATPLEALAVAALFVGIGAGTNAMAAPRLVAVLGAAEGESAMASDVTPSPSHRERTPKVRRRSKVANETEQLTAPWQAAADGDRDAAPEAGRSVEADAKVEGDRQVEAGPEVEGEPVEPAAEAGAAVEPKVEARPGAEGEPVEPGAETDAAPAGPSVAASTRARRAPRPATPGRKRRGRGSQQAAS